MLKLLCSAKINLTLDVLRRREDGFHEIDTVFQSVGLCDELWAERKTSGEDELVVDGAESAGVPADGANLALRAVAAYRERLGGGRPLRLKLTKNIPHGAGLGGGSSNAAAALFAAHRLWASSLPPEELEALAAAIGSDCAFFLRGGAARGTGRGELLARLPLKRAAGVVLAVPQDRVATAGAYRGLDPERDFGARSDAEQAARWLAGASDDPGAWHNAFERSVFDSHPACGALAFRLGELGALRAGLSGSGSACYGVFADWPAARAAAESLAGAAPVVRAVPFMDRSLVVMEDAEARR
ncbi:MAG: 4-(cytidine 5'-diphospho)-2-C-methyl-D-erythritol kinase [Candidatus Sumerlaeia bacterium]|nr:4-(cytidine 5'-diphospho)-2-C-methyl-D-erythritol kinase [Candidatus Sumerlaeia bacterium]